jgi:Flp pilus assembly protein TadD
VDHLAQGTFMDRSPARLAAVLLLGTALTACSSFSLDAPAAKTDTHQAAAAKATTSPKSMAADLDVQVANAQALRAQGDYQGATKILSQLMLVVPDNAHVVGEYGKTLVQEGRSKEALDFLKRAVELSPGDWTLYSASGVAYDQNGQYASAKVAYQQALSLKPGNAAVLNNYALSRMQAGDLPGANQLMAQAQAAGGADPKIASNTALLASLSPAQAPQAKASAAPAYTPAPAKTAVARAATPRPVETVMMEQIPVDPKAGPVKSATAAPRKLIKDAPPAAVAHAAAPKKVAATAPKPEPKKVAATAPKTDPKKAASAKTKTPALRMTADAATP